MTRVRITPEDRWDDHTIEPVDDYGYGTYVDLPDEFIAEWRRVKRDYNAIQECLESFYDAAQPKPEPRPPLSPIEAAMAGWYLQRALRASTDWLNDELLPRVTGAA